MHETRGGQCFCLEQFVLTDKLDHSNVACEPSGSMAVLACELSGSMLAMLEEWSTRRRLFSSPIAGDVFLDSCDNLQVASE